MENENIVATLIGVVGTLLGTVLGWFLNSYSYRMGKTTIWATLSTQMEIPHMSENGSNDRNQQTPLIEYFFDCTATNTRQVPIVLKNFRVEMRKTKRGKPINLSVLAPKMSYAEAGKFKIGVQLQLEKQRIEPRSITEFVFKVDCKDINIQYSKIDLIAYNERNKKVRFEIYNGLRIERPTSPK